MSEKLQKLSDDQTKKPEQKIWRNEIHFLDFHKLFLYINWCGWKHWWNAKCCYFSAWTHTFYCSHITEHFYNKNKLLFKCGLKAEPHKSWEFTHTHTINEKENRFIFHCIRLKAAEKTEQYGWNKEMNFFLVQWSVKWISFRICLIQTLARNAWNIININK